MDVEINDCLHSVLCNMFIVYLYQTMFVTPIVIAIFYPN